MSTGLQTITGVIEIPDTGKKKSNYFATAVNLGSFSGGKDRGHSLQISFTDEKGEDQHIQLNNANTRALIRILVEEFVY